MPRKSQFYRLCGTGIEETKEHTLASTYANRLGSCEQFVIEKSILIGHIERIHRRSHTYQGRLPMMNGEKDFLIVTANVIFRLDIEESILASVGSAREVVLSRSMRVIPASPGGFRCKAISQLSMRRNHRRAFLHRSVVD